MPRRRFDHPFCATRGLKDRDESLILKTPVDFSGIRLSFENQDSRTSSPPGVRNSLGGEFRPAQSRLAFDLGSAFISVLASKHAK